MGNDELWREAHQQFRLLGKQIGRLAELAESCLMRLPSSELADPWIDVKEVGRLLDCGDSGAIATLFSLNASRPPYPHDIDRYTLRIQKLNFHARLAATRPAVVELVAHRRRREKALLRLARTRRP